jgi:hypothetical protein
MHELKVDELESMRSPLEWWEHVGYAITAIGALVAIAAT